MNRSIALLAFAAAALGNQAAVAEDRDAETLARGKYLVTVAGCNDCHTPWQMGPAGPEPDMSRMVIPRAFRSPHRRRRPPAPGWSRPRRRTPRFRVRGA